MPDNFDPDKYIAEKLALKTKSDSNAFDPDKYIAEKLGGVSAPETNKVQPSDTDAFGRGAAQGIFLNSADEITAGLAAGYLKTKDVLGLGRPIDLKKEYVQLRDLYRAKDSEVADKGAFLAGQIGGGMATAFVPGLSALNAAKGATAANIIGKGALQGVLSGTGNAENWTDIPSEALRGAAWGAGTSGAMLAPGKAFKYAKDKLPEVAAWVVGGVEPKNLNAYLANPERINAIGQLPETAIKDNIDDAVKNALTYKTSLNETAKGLEDGLNRAYDAKKQELIGAITPLVKAKELSGSLSAQKNYLKSLSEQADDALTRSGMTFKKSDLLRTIDGIGKGAGPAVGDEAYNALAKLQATRDRIAEQLPKDISAVQMRDVLKQLRKDIDFDMGAGQFNDSLNGMRKEFSSNVSKALKQNKEYSAYMDRMAELSGSLDKMNRYFGDDVKALGSLETLRKGGAKAQPIQEALKTHALLNDDQTILKSLEELDNAHALLGKMKSGEDLRPSLFPKQWSELQEATANAKMADHVYSGETILEHPMNKIESLAPLGSKALKSVGEVSEAIRLPQEIPSLGGVSRLSPERTQSIIKNMGGNNVSIESKRELENLGRLADRNFLQDIEDKNVFDSFKKGQTNGSRMTKIGENFGALVGGGIGTAFGGLVGGAVGVTAGKALGGIAGGALDKYGPAIVKGTADSAIKLKALAANSNGWQAFGPYAKILADAASKGNSQLAIVNQVLLRTDPNYAKIFESKKQPYNQDAIKRRLGQ